MAALGSPLNYLMSWLFKMVRDTKEISDGTEFDF
jgi:hypothetical protein